MSERKAALVARLQKGGAKTTAILGRLGPDQWGMALYEDPHVWTVRDLLAHFLSAEEGLLKVGQDIAAGGPGMPRGFDYDAFNGKEQERLAGIPAEQLLADLTAARERTVEWVGGLAEADLNREGYHAALGEVTLETLINAIYGHQLMHMRDLGRRLG